MSTDTFVFKGQYDVYTGRGVETIAVRIEFSDAICLETCRLTLCTKGSIIASHYEGIIKEGILSGEIQMSYSGSICACCGGDNFSRVTEKHDLYPPREFRKFIEEARNRRHYWYYDIICRV